MRRKRVRWIPLLSFCSLLFTLSVVGAWFFDSSTSGVFSYALAIGGGILTIFPTRTTALEKFWDTAILPKTHISLIIIACTIVLLMIVYILPNYKVVKKNPI